MGFRGISWDFMGFHGIFIYDLQWNALEFIPVFKSRDFIKDSLDKHLEAFI